jgi:predicted nucleic acid binding AN1-type Zn finger protein
MDNNDIFNQFTNFMNLFNDNQLETKYKDNNKDFIHSISNTDKNKIEDDKKQDDIINKTASKKLKCCMCKVKISIVDSLISTCKCNQNYCAKHRMPENHKCEKLDEICKEKKKDLETSLIKIQTKTVDIL